MFPKEINHMIHWLMQTQLNLIEEPLGIGAEPRAWSLQILKFSYKYINIIILMFSKFSLQKKKKKELLPPPPKKKKFELVQ